MSLPPGFSWVAEDGWFERWYDTAITAVASHRYRQAAECADCQIIVASLVWPHISRAHGADAIFCKTCKVWLEDVDSYSHLYRAHSLMGAEP